LQVEISGEEVFGDDLVGFLQDALELEVVDLALVGGEAQGADGHGLAVSAEEAVADLEILGLPEPALGDHGMLLGDPC